MFNIKKEVYDIYNDTPSVLFNFFNYLYRSNKEYLDYGNLIFNQVANVFDKDKLDLEIFLKYHNNYKYSKRKEEHIINNLYKDEISIMKIKKSYIIINSNKNYTEFFKMLGSKYNECLVCDFINRDYFYLSNIKILV